MEGRKETSLIGRIIEGAADYIQQSREEAEKKAVANFRNNSENIQKLIDIKKASEESKQSLFGNFSFVKTWNQLDSLGVEKINAVLAATTFAGMLQALDIHFRDENEKWKAETLCSIAGNVVQDANAAHYLLQLHKEILAYVIQHDYPLTKNNQRPTPT